MADTAAQASQETPPISPAAESYDRGHGGESRGREVAAILAPHLAEGRIADVGTATGVVALGLTQLGFPVVGVDIDANLLTAAHARLGADNVIQADAHSLPFDAGSLSNVVYVHVLHLLADMPAGLAEAVRVLRPGGRLLAVHGVPGADLGDMAAPFEPLRPLTHLKDEPHLLDPAASAAGLRLVHRELVLGYDGGMTPNQYADSIQKRVWSYLSNLDEQTWSARVEPVIAGLRALPDPDAERHLSWRVHFSVYERA